MEKLAAQMPQLLAEPCWELCLQGDKLASCWLGAQHLSPEADVVQLEAGAPEVEMSPSPPLLGRVKDKLRQPKLQRAWAGNGVLSQGDSLGPKLAAGTSSPSLAE